MGVHSGFRRNIKKVNKESYVEHRLLDLESPLPPVFRLLLKYNDLQGLESSFDVRRKKTELRYGELQAEKSKMGKK